MFYQISDSKIIEIDLKEFDDNLLTVGYIEKEEFSEVKDIFGFEQDMSDFDSIENTLFRTSVDVHSNYTCTQLKVVNSTGTDDLISIYIKNNLVLLVTIIDEDGSTRENIISNIKRHNLNKLNLEKLICFILEATLTGCNKTIEIIKNKLNDMEESVITGKAEKKLTSDLFKIKKMATKYDNYFSQILDITETLEENDNDILSDENLIYISNISHKVSRLKDEVSFIHNNAEHLQDAYNSALDQQLNNTMNKLTILTTIFFPLTIIVGWYGMNFISMPEFNWKFGYIYVILLSIFTVSVLSFIGKKKRWF